MYDFLIVGGGVFGIFTAIELSSRKYKVGLLNPNTIPHHMAASTDISKVVRMEYGSDHEYFKMAERSIIKWKEWNDRLNYKIYHEVGFLMLSKAGIKDGPPSYERHSYEMLRNEGYNDVQLVSKENLKARYPSINAHAYRDGCFNPHGGYVTSGKAIKKLADYARSIGVDIHESQTCSSFELNKNRLEAIRTNEGQRYACGHAIICAGVHSPVLLPELQPYIKSTGHPVYWLKPQNPQYFKSEHLPVFMADIANTGWYGFPYLEKHGVVKIAKHADGLELHPDKDDRQITDKEVAEMRDFVKYSFPKLSDASLVYSRRCLYTDTLDGHFWIDQHPEIKGLSVGTGGSGHGMKMGPELGRLIADMAERNANHLLKRYRWRHLDESTNQEEECRYIRSRE